MQYFTDAAPGKTILISFDPGDLILEGIEEVVRREGIDFGMVTGGVGSLQECHFQVATNPAGTPPAAESRTVVGPIQLGSIQGTIVNGEVHVHVTIYEYSSNQVYLGHLEAGSRVLNLMEVCLQTGTSLRLARVREFERGVFGFRPREEAPA
ncbi:MAG: DNA-binding protein [Chloroflexi bacterium]|nr:DNA-binding protein [Chloroflexota bacterium]